MAHTILGMDLGSASVKVAQLEAGFRSVRLIALHERELPPPGEGEGEAATLRARQLATLRALVMDSGLRPEMTAAALGEEATLRVVGLPISDRKKVEQVLPFELEGQLLGEIDEHVVDHLVAQGGLTMDEGQAGQGSRVIAAAAPRTAVKDLIDQLDAAGLEPRLIGAAALRCAALLTEPQPGDQAEWPVMIIDLGHRTTQVCMVDGGPGQDVAATFARTISRGSQQLIQGLARVTKTDLETAQRLLHRAEVAPPGEGSALSDPHVTAALHEGLRPLLRDLRQTVASYMALYGEGPRQILLTGGGARLRGIDALLAHELALPVGFLQVPPSLLTGALAGPVPGGAALEDAGLRCAAALGLALAVAAPAPQVNLRKGEFAYRTDYSFLREKAPQLAAIALALVLCAGLSALASLRGLQKESDQLVTALRNETMQLFGEPRTDGKAVSAELSSVINSTRGGGQTVPGTSALDLVEEISRAAPAADGQPGGQGAAGAKKTGLDITELNIRPKKTDLKGTAGSAQYVDDLAAALGKIPCFKTVEKGKVITVRNTGADGKPIDVKQFSFAITSTCP